jgi:hypothetical protein
MKRLLLLSILWIFFNFTVNGQTYCIAKGPDTCGTLLTNSGAPGVLFFDFDQIERVELIGDNSSTIDHTDVLIDCQNGLGYGDYTSISPAIWNAGSSYQVTVERIDKSNIGNVAKMFVDWNDDKDFTDPGEGFDLQWVPILAIHVSSIPVPPGYTDGIKRVRIRTAIQPDIPSSCGEQEAGEVEDYLIDYKSSISLLVPDCANLLTPTDNTTDLCTGSQLFTWNKATGDPDGYAFYLGTDNPPTNVNDDKDVGTATSYTNTTALAANTTYYWRVKAYNVFGESTGCDVFQFTTAASVDPSITQILIEGNNIDSTGACINEDLLITANISGGSGTVVFDWSGSDVYLDDNAINNPTFNTANNPSFTSSDANKTYTLKLTVEDANLCSARDSIKIHVKDNPTPGTLSADKTSVCPDEDVTLTLTGYTDNIQDWEQEIAGGSYASIGNINDVFTTSISDDTKFKVLVEKDGCVLESNEVTITLKAAPLTPIINVSPGNSVCEGETITLTATPETDIVWNDAGSSTTNPIDVTSDGTFNVTYTDPTTTCSATSTDEVLTFSALPADPIITATGDLCSGSTVELSTQYTGVSWDLNGTGTANTDAIDVTTDGAYGVTYTDPTTNCTSYSNESIVFNPLPETPVIEQKGDSLITNPLQVVDWLDADGNVVHTGDSYSPDRAADQTFTAVVIDGNDCASDESNEIAYDHTISILSYALVRFDVFPNPATDELNIVVHAATSAGVYQLKDMTGRTIKQVILFEGQSVVSITDIDSGVYLLQHESGSAVRVVKQ